MPCWRHSRIGTGRIRPLDCGPETLQLWTGSDERSWLGWLSLTDDSDPSPGLEQIVQEIRRERLSHLLAAGNGGLQPLSRSSGRNFRQAARIPGTSRPGLHRPRTNPAFRLPNRPVANPLHRFQQVRQHPGTRHSETVLLSSECDKPWVNPKPEGGLWPSPTPVPGCRKRPNGRDSDPSFWGSRP